MNQHQREREAFKRTARRLRIGTGDKMTQYEAERKLDKMITESENKTKRG